MTSKKTEWTGGNALMQALLDNGAQVGFGVPGESYLAVLDAMVDHRDQFKFVTCRHEATASNMAEAYGKLTGHPGLCFVTRGPGATHATTGLHTAFQDSTPMIMLIGQVASNQVEREAFQEIDYRRFLSEVTKWSAEINDPGRIAEYVGRAFRVATSGRPGPVALALPEDMLTAPCQKQISKTFEPAIAAPATSAISRFKTLLNSAKRPVIMAGGSGWTGESVAALQTFAANHQIGVMASFRCQDRFDNDHPNYIGDMGIGANPALVDHMQQSDLIIVLGARLGEMTTAGYTRLQSPVPEQTLVHIHQGAEEIGRVYQPTLGINASPETFLSALKRQAIAPGTEWHAWLKAGRQNYEKWNRPNSNTGDVQLAEIYHHIAKITDRDTIICNGAGNYTSWLHRFYRYRAFPTQLAPTSGAMGYGVPAAIAAKVTHPERTVICAAGDGCFMMSAMELATVAKYDLGIIFLVFNNGMYGTIRMHQEKHFPGRISATDLVNPDFMQLATSFGIDGERVKTTDQFKTVFDRMLQSGRAGLIEIIADPTVITPTANLSDL